MLDFDFSPLHWGAAVDGPVRLVSRTEAPSLLSLFFFISTSIYSNIHSPLYVTRRRLLLPLVCHRPNHQDLLIHLLTDVLSQNYQSRVDSLENSTSRLLSRNPE